MKLDSIIESYKKLKAKTHDYGEELRKTKQYVQDVFSPVFNNTTLVLEVLDNYKTYWSKSYSGFSDDQIEKLKKQNAERIIEITKWSFIHIISCYEFSAKEIIKNTSLTEFADLKSKLQGGGRVYLGGIMEVSKNSHFISDDDYEKWDGIIFIRNCLVHNNGISDKKASLDIGNVKINCEKDKMLSGKLDIFHNLCDTATDLFNQWLYAI